MNEPTEKKILSLADFASESTDDIATLTSRLPAAGTFIVKGKSVEVVFVPATTPEHDDLFRVTWEHEILEVVSLVKDSDNDEEKMANMVGQTRKESYTLWPNSKDELMGLIKGNYQKIGLPNAGAPGGIPEVEGWLDGIVDYPYELRIRHYHSGGQDRAGYDWKKADDSILEAMGKLPADEGGDA